MFRLRNKTFALFLRLCVYTACLFIFFNQKSSESSYLPVTGSNIGIGTSTPVGALTIMSGNVGIGTWSPTSRLQVIGTIAATAFVGDGSGLSNLPTTGGWTDGGTNVYTSTTTDLVAIGTTTPVSTLTVKGNVGIGTTTPYTTIAASLNGMLVEGNVGIGTFAASNGKLVVMGGNVGIGTTSPGFPLSLGNNLSFSADDFGWGLINSSALRITINYDGTRSMYFIQRPSGIGIGIADSDPDAKFEISAGGDTSDELFMISSNNDTDGDIFNVDGTGNIGIGTINPKGRLVVNGGVGIGTLNTSTFINTAAPAGGLLVQNNVGIGTTIPVGGLVVMNGNVGIGTWSPTSRLQVIGTVDATAFVGDGSGLTNLPTSGGWTDGGTNVYTSTTTDLVAIGTTTPVSTLTVKGNVGIGTTMPYSTIAAPANGMIVEGNVGIGTFDVTSAKMVVMGGNVGIGTAAPNARFEIKADSSVSTVMNIKNSSNLDILKVTNNFDWAALQLYDHTGTVKVRLDTNLNSGAFIRVDATTMNKPDFEDYDDGAALSIVTPLVLGQENGVFFGANQAGASPGGAITWFPTDTSNWGMGGLNFKTASVGNGSTTRMTIDQFGNIGLGTTKPGNRFAVNGGVSIGTLLNSAFVNATAPNGGLIIENNVGIGTTSPKSALQVYTTSSIGTLGQLTTGTPAVIHLALENAGTNGGNWYVGSSNDNFSVGGGGKFYVSPSTTTSFSRFTVLQGGNIGIGTNDPVGALTVMNGNVGIGTWSPTSRLQVIGTVNATAFVGDGSGLTNLPGGASGWTDGGTNIYTSTTTDNVAIGTTTPASTLTVVGNIGIGTTTQYRTIAGPINGMAIEGNVGIGTWAADRGKLIVMGGNVGIGSLSPGAKLSFSDLSGNSPYGAYFAHTGPAGSYGVGLYVDQNASSSSASAITGVKSSDGGYGVYGWSSAQAVSNGVGVAGESSGGGAGIGVYAGQLHSANTGYALQAYNNSPTGWTIFALGTSPNFFAANVGVGTLLPASKLVVNGGVGIGTINSSAFINSAAPSGGLIVENNVGIGTTSPGLKLDIRGSNAKTTNAALEYLSRVASSDAAPLALQFGIRTSSTTSGRYGAIEVEDNGAGRALVLQPVDGNVGIGTTTPIGGLTVMNGNVGIGTWIPTSRLQVIGTVNATAFVGDGSGLTNLPSGGGWTDGGTNVYTSTTTDNVGIGTTTPNAATFEVVKNAAQPVLKISSSATAGGDYLVINSEGNIGMGTLAPRGALVIMNGNVGIGTTAPAQSLHVANDVRIGTNLTLQGNLGSPSAAVRGPASGDLILGTNSATNLYLDFNGNVGVGGAPTKNLQVLGSTATTLRLNSGNVSVWDFDLDYSVNDNLTLSQSSGAGYFVISNRNVGLGTSTPVGALAVMNGNVGIGTWSPRYKLDNIGGFFHTGYNTQDIPPSDNTNGGLIVGWNRFSGGGAAEVNFYNAYHSGGVTMSYLFSQKTSDSTVDDLMAIMRSGNVGIGTTAPVGGLVVMTGNTGIGTWSPTARLQVIGTVNATAFVGDGSGLTNLPGGASGWTDGGTNVYTSTTTDNVGIGTTTPSTTLEIVKQGSSAPLMISASATGDGDLFTVTSEGNVGIGTVSPNAVFEVKGSSSLQVITNPDLWSTVNITKTTTSWNKPDGNNEPYGWLLNLTVPESTNYENGIEFSNVASSSGPFAAIVAQDTNGGFFEYGALNFRTRNGGNLLTRLTITDAGNIGAGTTTPASRFVVNGGVGIGTINTSTFLNTTAPSGGLIVEGNVGIGTFTPFVPLETGQTVAHQSYASETQPYVVVEHTFGTGYSGTVSAFHTGGDTVAPFHAGVYGNATGNGMYGLIIATSHNSSWTTATNALSTGKYLGGIGLAGHTDGNNGTGTTMGASIIGQVDGTVSSGVLPSALIFNTSQTNSTGLTERLRISSSGNIGIGTDMTSASAKLAVLGGNVGIGTIAPVGALAVMNGNVGIGTWSPTQRLQVVGTVAATAFVGDGSGLTGISAGGWTDGGTNVYTSTTTDNVGIGTTRPNAATFEIVKNAAQPILKVSSAAAGNGDFLVIGSTGNIGIGSINPANRISVYNDSAGDDIKITTGAGQTANIFMQTANDQLSELIFRELDSNWGATVDYDGANNRFNISRVSSGVQTPALTLLRDSDSIGIFDQTPDATFEIAGNFMVSSNAAGDGNRFMIDNAGNVGIGTVSPVGGVAVMNGNVGIGTWSPTQRLQVVGTVAATAFVGDGSGLTGISAGGWTDGGTNVYTSTTTDNVGIGTTTPSTTLEIVKQSTRAPLMVSSTPTGDGDYLLVTSGGNVGIGTLTPAKPFEIKRDYSFEPLIRLINTNASGVSGIDMMDNNSAFQGAMGYFNASSAYGSTVALVSNTSDLSFITDDTGFSAGIVQMRIKSSSGNVGIGTINPVGALTVMNGNVGIGTWVPASRLNITMGNIGMGTTTPYRRIAGPLNGIAVEGNVGIGTWAANSGKLIVMGGSVGVGTVAPSFAIEVRGAGTAGGDLGASYISTNASGWANNRFVNSTGSDGWVGIGGNSTAVPYAGRAYLASSGGVSLSGDGPSADIRFYQGVSGVHTEWARFNTSGNFGIGTTTPVAGLAVMNGNVGIGTWSPVGALEIKGTGSAQVTINGASGGCLMFRDTDNAGWTECNALNGVLTCSLDADGICDGS